MTDPNTVRLTLTVTAPVGDADDLVPRLLGLPAHGDSLTPLADLAVAELPGPAPISPEVAYLVGRDKVIAAIKQRRIETGEGLKEAKDAVVDWRETMYRTHGAPEGRTAWQ